MGFVLVLGGARSGKSDLACRMAHESHRAVTCIATAAAGDDDMAARIERHRQTRPAKWATVEEPLELQAAIQRSPADEFLIVDCLTLWVANLLGAGRATEEICSLAGEVASDLVAREAVVVSNEVGLGIVPANELARTFRDTLGLVNVAFAARAQRSILLVAGRTLELA
jgi:adenosyl cobinamide kinase/adenosyl cobinamide phosphate guanylyltransferase